MSKPYAWENEEYTRKLRQAKPVSKKPMSFWMPPLAFSVLCYLLLLLRKLVMSLFFTDARVSVLALIEMDLYSYYAFFVLLFLPLLISVLFYINMIVLVPMREKAELMRPSESLDEEERRRVYQEQYKLYTQRKSVRWQIHAFYYILFAAQLALMAQGVFFGSAQRETALLHSDVNLLRTGDISVYDGRFHSTDRPLHNMYGYVIIPEKDFYYFTSDVGTLRCLKSNLSSSDLMQSNYRVEYLPGTYTVVSITNADGVLLTGTDGPSIASLPEGTWLYGDLIVKNRFEVYGYDLLTEDGQKAFDLMYGEYYSQAVSRGEESTHSFSLPKPISKEEYFRVLSLYKAATAWYSRPPWRYDTNDTYDKGMIKTVYAGGIHYSDERLGTQFFETREKAAQIVSDMPPGLGDTEKCDWLARYLVENVRYYTEEKPQTDFVDKNGITLRVSIPAQEHTTAYGALIEGAADSVGYSSAFAALAQEADIPCIYVVGETAEGPHSWNMVKIGANWYHIDIISLMDDGDTMGEMYFLADDSRIKLTHTPVSYGECTFVPLPKSPSP